MTERKKKCKKKRRTCLLPPILPFLFSTHTQRDLWLKKKYDLLICFPSPGQQNCQQCRKNTTLGPANLCRKLNKNQWLETIPQWPSKSAPESVHNHPPPLPFAQQKFGCSWTSWKKKDDSHPPPKHTHLPQHICLWCGKNLVQHFLYRKFFLMINYWLKSPSLSLWPWKSAHAGCLDIARSIGISTRFSKEQNLLLFKN